jgi:hypothetical protein
LLLSHFIDFFPPSFYEGKQFLVLDDTVYQGKQMQDLVSQIIAKGASAECVRSASFVVHEQSSFKPNSYARELPDVEYVIWKESLANLVRQNSRTIDRDNPLYYFNITGTTSWELVNILSHFGVVQAPDEEWGESTFAFTLNVDSSIFQELADITNLELAAVSKLRLYLQRTPEGHLLTVAPMVLSTLTMESVHDPLLDRLSSILDGNGIYLARGESLKAQYFYVSRALSSLLLVRLLEQVTKMFDAHNIDATVESPSALDSPILYLFPDEYHKFYDSVLRTIRAVLQRSVGSDLPLTAAWPLPVGGAIVQKPLDKYLPQKYDILAYMTRASDPAFYDGTRWLPRLNGGPKPMTIDGLLEHFHNALDVSAAIDELLDSGMLKAIDFMVDDHKFTRAFLHGGEYNAVRVSRLVDALRAPVINIPADIAEREARDLWACN